MATTTIGSGKDYSTIAGWEAAETSNGDVGQIDEAATFAENVTIDGGSGDRELTVASAYRHANDETGAVIDPSSDGHAITCNEGGFTASYLRITGVSGSSSEAFRSNAADLTYRWCYVHDLTVTASHDFTFAINTATGLTIYGCCACNIDRAFVLVHSGQTWGTTTITMANCTGINVGINTNHNMGAIGGDTGLSGDLGNLTIYARNVVTDWSGSGTEVDAWNDGDGNPTNPLSWGSSDYNAADDATSPGANSVDSLTFSDEFTTVTAGSEDVTLKAGHSIGDAGTDASGVLTVDAIGNAFGDDGNWEIGAEAEIAAAGIIQQAYHHYHRNLKA